MKSSSESVNAIIKPETMPGLIAGKTTFLIALPGVQPRSCAASARFGSVCLSFGNMFKITYGKLNVTCAMNKVQKPRTPFILRIVPMKTNKSIIETPVTISGFIIGISVILMTAERRQPFFILSIPSAARVPITVDATEDAIASIIVL